MAVSIVDVAKKAGVSRMTVTRVMRNDAVREQTKRKVLEAMQELGYVPSSAARAMRSNDPLRSSQYNCFALVFGTDTQNADDFFCEVTRGIEQEAAKEGLCALQVHWLDDPEASWLKMQTVLSIKELCGVILIGSFLEKEILAIKKINQNIIVVDAPVKQSLGVGSVESDNVGGCKLALKHLADVGVKNPLVITGFRDHYFSQAMLSGAESYKKQFERITYIETDYSAKDSYKKVLELLKNGQKFDGIFTNDTLALGAIKALKESGVDVPKDVKIVGFDDIPVCDYLSPALSSVYINKQELGARSIQMLTNIIRKSPEEKYNKVEAILNIRQSSRS